MIKRTGGNIFEFSNSEITTAVVPKKLRLKQRKHPILAFHILEKIKGVSFVNKVLYNANLVSGIYLALLIR